MADCSLITFTPVMMGGANRPPPPPPYSYGSIIMAPYPKRHGSRSRRFLPGRHVLPSFDSCGAAISLNCGPSKNISGGVNNWGQGAWLLVPSSRLVVFPWGAVGWDPRTVKWHQKQRNPSSAHLISLSPLASAGCGPIGSRLFLKASSPAAAPKDQRWRLWLEPSSHSFHWESFLLAAALFLFFLPVLVISIGYMVI